MGKRVAVFSILGPGIALVVLLPFASLAADEGEPLRQAGENRWVPSFAITAGANIQNQHGSVESFLFQGANPVPVVLRPADAGDDLAVSPFVGGSLELMTPALPIPTRPRLFLAGEILPTFASERDLGLEGNPADCIRSPIPGAPCAKGFVPVDTTPAFDEGSATGVGSKTDAQVDTLVFGANLGVAFPIRAGKRQLRIKPSFGWINYKVDAGGTVVAADCNPSNRCTDSLVGDPPVLLPGFLRETILEASDSAVFNGIGPGLDLEMDVGHYGPLGVSLFLGARAYYILGNRTIAFSTSETFSDQVGDDVAVGNFEVEVDPWMYRGNLGIRFQWLGFQD